MFDSVIRYENTASDKTIHMLVWVWHSYFFQVGLSDSSDFIVSIILK